MDSSVQTVPESPHSLRSCQASWSYQRDVIITPGQRLSFLQQDHFKYDQYTVLDTVIMGNKRLYEIMKEKEAIYMKEDFTDEDGIKAAELEGEFANMNGWEAESDAESLLNGLGIEPDLHYAQMGSFWRQSKYSGRRPCWQPRHPASG